VASKAAMDAFARCAASEFADNGVEFTTVNMPLVRTAMTAPTEFYRQVPMLTPEEAAELVAQAIIQRPTRVATRLGIFAQIVHLVAPRLSHLIMNTAYRVFPESKRPGGAQAPASAQAHVPSPDQIAIAQLMKGIHF
jgi:NAD(P)-dependent dehydrogenase (short-subunit alcohol dehydrogenase family)